MLENSVIIGEDGGGHAVVNNQTIAGKLNNIYACLHLITINTGK